MTDLEQRLYDALKRISLYDRPERIRRDAGKRYGLEPGEAVEMAYENILAEAKAAVKGMRRPKTAQEQAGKDGA